MRKQETERYAPMFEIAIVDLSDPDFDMESYSIEAQALFSTMQLIRELADRDTLPCLATGYLRLRAGRASPGRRGAYRSGCRRQAPIACRAPRRG